jgi:hypothetical protein
MATYYYSWSYNANSGSGAPSGGSSGRSTSSSYTINLSSTKPTRTGYTFNYWTISVTNGSANRSTVSPGGSVKITGTASKSTTVVFKASWTVKYYTLSVSAGTGGTVSGGGSFAYNTYHTISASPNSGYTFGSWSDGGAQSHSVLIKTSGNSYTASFNRIYYQYYLTYDADGGSPTPNRTGKYTYETTWKTTVSSTIPTKSGYTFLNWGGYTPGQDITLYSSSPTRTLKANWSLNTYTYSLIYDDNGGSGGPGPKTKTVTNESQCSFDIVSTTPSWPGYNFKGWATSSSATSPNVGTSIVVSYDGVSRSRTIYAVWEKIPYYFTLYFRYNNGTSDNYTSLSGQNTTGNSYPFAIPDGIPSWSGHTFTSWYTTHDSSGKGYNSRDQYNVACTTSYGGTSTDFLFAGWKFTINFDSNGGDAPEYSSKTVVYDAAVGSLPDVSWDQHKFLGWFTAKSGGTQLTTSTLCTMAAGTTYYAHWETFQYTVTTLRSGGDATCRIEGAGTYDYGSTHTLYAYTKDSGEVYSGYKFDHWEWDGGTSTSYSLTITVPARDITYTAVFVQRIYTVTFKPNGCPNLPEPTAKTVQRGTKFGELADISWDEYHIFEGWVTSDGVAITKDIIFSYDENITLYAYWKVITKYRLICYHNDGTPTFVTKSQDADADEVEFDISDIELTREGYEFKGWATSSTATEPDLSTTITLHRDSSTTESVYKYIYAVWKVKTYLINFKVSKEVDESKAEIVNKPTQQEDSYVPYDSIVTISNNTLKISKDGITYINVYAQDTSGLEGFLKWSLKNGDQIKSATTITAYFSKIEDLCKITIDISADTSTGYVPGTISDSDGGVLVLPYTFYAEKGNNYSFTAKSNSGFKWKSWEASNSIIIANKETCTINVPQGVNVSTLIANFTKKYINFIVDSNDKLSNVSYLGVVTGSFINVEGDTSYIGPDGKEYSGSTTFSQNGTYQIQDGAAGTFTWTDPRPKSGYDRFEGWYWGYTNSKTTKPSPTIRSSADNPYSITTILGVDKYNWLLYYAKMPDNLVYVKVNIEPDDGGLVTYDTQILKGDSIHLVATANSGYEFKGFYLNNICISTSNVYDYTIPTDYELNIITIVAKFAMHVSITFSPTNVKGWGMYKDTTSDKPDTGDGDWYYDEHKYFHRILEETDKTQSKNYEYICTTYYIKSNNGGSIQNRTTKKDIAFTVNMSTKVTSYFKSLTGEVYSLSLHCITESGENADDKVDLSPGAGLFNYNYTSTSKPTIYLNCTVKDEYEDEYKFSHWDDTNTTQRIRSLTLDSNKTLKAVIKELISYTPRITNDNINTYNKYYWPRYSQYYPPEGYNPYGGGANPLITPDIVGNCTWYAWGRTCEIAVVDLGKVHSGCLWIGNACNWFSSAFRTGGNTWAREGEADPTIDPGREISYWNVGDILCFTGKWGHVAIVEAINGDELTISESGYKITTGYFWRLSTHKKFTLNESWQGVRFQGVIHNPYAGKSNAMSVDVIAMPTDAGEVYLGEDSGRIDQKQIITAQGSRLYFNAIVNEGHTFNGWWTGDGEKLSDKQYFAQSIGTSMTVIACFDGYNTKDYVQISAYPTPEEGGEVLGGGTYTKGDEVTLDVIPTYDEETGVQTWFFTKWSDGSTDLPYTFKATKSTVIYAIFSTDPEGRDQGLDMGYCDWMTMYGDELPITIKKISLSAYIYYTDGSSDYDQFRPAMTLKVGDKTYDIPESTNPTEVFEKEFDEPVNTKDLVWTINDGYTTEVYNSFNLCSFDITYSRWDPDSGESTYHRYYDGTKWTEWVEEVNNE